jgi:Protein of unknown function (DUF3108)
MMKMKKYSAIFFVPIIIGLFAFVQMPKPVDNYMETVAGDACYMPNTTFQNGEEITYKIYYNWNFVWLTAGEVTFKVWDEGTQYHYQAIGKTYDSYEWFFTVNDQYDSWVDKNSLLPNYSERSVEEGKYHIFEKIAFNQALKKTMVSRADHRGANETQTNHDVKDCVHDVLSSMFTLRNVEFENQNAGYSMPFNIFMDKEEFSLKMRYRGKDDNKKVHNMGRYRTMKFQPDVIKGNVFKDDAKMTVWVSDDQNRIPIMIESPVSVGSVKVVLKSYKGLKYDFKAKR